MFSRVHYWSVCKCFKINIWRQKLQKFKIRHEVTDKCQNLTEALQSTLITGGGKCFKTKDSKSPDKLLKYNKSIYPFHLFMAVEGISLTALHPSLFSCKRFLLHAFQKYNFNFVSFFAILYVRSNSCMYFFHFKNWDCTVFLSFLQVILLFSNEYIPLNFIRASTMC